MPLQLVQNDQTLFLLLNLHKEKMQDADSCQQKFFPMHCLTSVVFHTKEGWLNVHMGQTSDKTAEQK